MIWDLVFQVNEQESLRQKLQCLLWPSLGSHPLSYAQFPIQCGIL